VCLCVPTPTLVVLGGGSSCVCVAVDFRERLVRMPELVSINHSFMHEVVERLLFGWLVGVGARGHPAIFLYFVCVVAYGVARANV